MDMADKVDLFKHHGYSVDTLMKDMRFKVSAALNEAGLQNSSYGKQVLKGLGSNLQTRPDMLGSGY